MFIRAVNGSTFQCVGSDAVASGSVLARRSLALSSRYALANPSAWARIDQFSRKTTVEPRSSLLPEDAIIYFHCTNMPSNPATGSLNCSPRRYWSIVPPSRRSPESTSRYTARIATARCTSRSLCSFNAAGSLGSFFAREMAALRNEAVSPTANRCRAFRCIVPDLQVGDDPL
jgi:hypothetical protein